MIIFLWLFTTLVFGIAYLFQLLHLSVLGLELIAIILLLLSFWFRKNGDFAKLISMNVVMVFVMLVLYFSHRTFTYIHPGDVEKIMEMMVSFALAEAVGIFWGRLFYKHAYKKTS